MRAGSRFELTSLRTHLYVNVVLHGGVADGAGEQICVLLRDAN